ncbi:Transcriptional regulatory protein BtsR [Flavobacterium bizetiae]|uniref:Transcriptional regulatory protein BtsR n=1 Tax=Flavobacterium bizetiae TaxID=2704140 RepID=A0A6J4GE48_9FLAO|nr:LytTR family DNA-binding domain-containing protein [Flavobacterium bizetiae]CAA9196300.1 Transcriptional regulatory protein BtsR [Flavobacterium bizetiae]CAD5342854.1 Transcriptional regulatory protein BtsR [Flavobacterium bizetiae]CAD5348563.1 Transcriptional regulatory protein BtsR [Flavobacterium bizetiae]
MKKIKVVIIDDERLAREEIKRALQFYEDFVLIGEAENADDAKILIETEMPDLIFLDIQMPEKSGFDLLESLDNVPAVLFITAYDQYAIQAFEVSALDYLMKPIREERFAKAIQKIRDAINMKFSLNDSLAKDRKIFIKDGEKRFFIQLDEIYLIESLENYTRLFFQDKKALQRRSLRQWEEILDKNIFFRINRTEIINIQYIQEVKTTIGGRLEVKLKTGELLEVSNRQSARFRNQNGI